MRSRDISRIVVRGGRKILEKHSQRGAPYVGYVNINVAVYVLVHGANEWLLRKTTMPLASFLLDIAILLIHAAHHCVLASVSLVRQRMRP